MQGKGYGVSSALAEGVTDAGIASQWGWDVARRGLRLGWGRCGGGNDEMMMELVSITLSGTM